MRMFQADCLQRDVELSLDIGSGVKLLGSRHMLKADPSRLQQIQTNILVNAIKFTAKRPIRKVTISVDVRLRPPEPDGPIVPPPMTDTSETMSEDTPLYLFIAVTDTAGGMTEEELGKLFMKFSQANKEIHTQMGGNGLGLFIAKQLCRLQSGRIEAVSQYGIGSTFRFFIEARSVLQVDDIVRPNSTPAKLPSMTADMKRLHILVVDDNVINRKTLSRQLRVNKHDVVMGEDGQEALVSVAHASFCLLFLTRLFCRTSSLLMKQAGRHSTASLWTSTCR